MTITTLDQLIAAQKYILTHYKSASITSVAAIPFTGFHLAGNPGAGTLNVGNTANGLVHTSATAGYPAIPSFGGAAGYISRMTFSSSVACRIMLFDRVFVAGAYAYNADVTLASQPSYATRNGGSYAGLQIWLEAVTAHTGSQSIQINYLDQDGGAGDTGVVATGVAPILGRCYHVPLAAGDSGVQRIDRVRSTVSSAGTFNVMVLRPLWEGRIPLANFTGTDEALKVGLPLIYDTSALYVPVAADSTARGLPYMNIQVAVG
jgi:hypothetical protein